MPDELVTEESFLGTTESVHTAHNFIVPSVPSLQLPFPYTVLPCPQGRVDPETGDKTKNEYTTAKKKKKMECRMEGLRPGNCCVDGHRRQCTHVAIVRVRSIVSVGRFRIVLYHVDEQ